MVQVRHATPNDIPDLARLIAQMGFQASEEAISELWQNWSDGGNVALVIEETNSIIGLISLHRMIVLHRPKPVGRITSLIVDGTARRRGLGKALVAAAEDLLKAQGCGLIEVTSNNRLIDAHGFYRSLGYEETSRRFAKPVE